MSAHYHIVTKSPMRDAHNTDDHKARESKEKSILAHDIEFIEQRAFKAAEAQIKAAEVRQKQLSDLLGKNKAKNVVIHDLLGRDHCYQWKVDHHILVGQFNDVPSKIRRLFVEAQVLSVRFSVQE